MAPREHSAVKAVDLEKSDPDTDEQILADLAAAEAAAEAARERARLARARAATLRQEATAKVEADAKLDADDDAEQVPVDDPSDVTQRKLRGLASWQALVILVAVLIMCGSVALGAVMVSKDRAQTANSRSAAEFTTAAAAAATTLMSIGHDTAREDVQHILDISTGDVHAQYQDTADDLIKQLESSQVVTKVSVTETAIESMDANSAVVLIAARTQRTTTGESAQDPADQQLWRLALTMTRVGDQIKVSKLEFQ